jgi:hypothetical protein
MSVGLKDELLVLKGKLEILEKELTDKMLDLEVRAEKWAQIDEKVDEIIKDKKNFNLLLNVGGKVFQTKIETFISIKDTLFYNMIYSKRIDLNKEIFFDRDHKYFHIILYFLRNKKVNLSEYSSKELKSIKIEAEFYNIIDLISNINELFSKVFFVSFEVNGNYISSGVVAGTQIIEDLNDFEDKSCLKGICSNSPGFIILEINRQVSFESIEICGWKGNTSIWSPSNGSNSRILTSQDKETWVDVGSVGSNFDSIQKCNLIKSKAKYIKIQSTSYLGIGYLRIIEID